MGGEVIVAHRMAYDPFAPKADMCEYDNACVCYKVSRGFVIVS
jgi:hypothetical protein